MQVQEITTPAPGPGESLLRVSACGVCRSNLHMIEGEWVSNGTPAKLPIVPGHEIVGRVALGGEVVVSFKKGDRAGVQPLWSTCGRCEYCLTGREQLCQIKHITGETVDAVTPSISWRRPGTPTQYLNRSQKRRPKRSSEVEARMQPSFAPSSTLVRQAISAIKPGGIVVLGAFAEIGPLPFVEEKTVVGSLLGSRQQMFEVLQLSAAGKVRSVCEIFPLEQAEEALLRLKCGEFKARAVLVP